MYDFILGESAEGRSLNGYAFMLGTDAENWEDELKKRPSIFINAVHHARELTTISQVIYTMLSLLHGYEHQNQS